MGKRNSGGIELPNQECIRTFGEKESYKYLWIMEAYQQTSEDEGNNKKRVPKKNEKISWNQALLKKSH